MLPSISHKKLTKALKKLGYTIARQKGSHIRMIAADKISVTIPKHYSVAKGTLRKIIRDLNISVTELNNLLSEN